jgi:glycosyltransferase involved in cell wall biosynthesis
MAGQKNKRVAIVTHTLGVVSETFVQAQIDLLPADIVLHSGSMPAMVGEKNIQSKFHERVNKILFPFLKRDFFSLEESIVRLLLKERIEIVLAQFGPMGVSVLPVCQKAGIKLIVHFHGFDACRSDVLKSYAASYVKMFAYAKAIIAVSAVMVEQLKQLGCPEHKIILIHYGVNELFFKATPAYDTDVFCAIGRFIEKKGPLLTIQSYAKVVGEFPGSRLYMAGDGYLMNDCKQLVRDLGLERNVFFPGVLKHFMVPAFMQKSIAFVQHSIVADSGDSEGTPVAIIEASAAALPVIATRHAGIPDVVLDGITGLLVPEKDIDKMADAMRFILRNKALARSMGEAGRERIKSNFTMERYISILREALNN